jgi:hypothetical protein
MWWKVLIPIIYVLIAIAVGRYVYIRYSYKISQDDAYSLETAKDIVNSNYAVQWFLYPLFWPISLTIYLIFNGVDRLYFKSQKERRETN